MFGQPLIYTASCQPHYSSSLALFTFERKQQSSEPVIMNSPTQIPTDAYACVATSPNTRQLRLSVQFDIML